MIGFVYLIKINIFVSFLFGFRACFFFVNQLDIWTNEIYRSIIKFSKLLCYVITEVSSAYIATWHFHGIRILRQNILNRVGPSISWTPAFIECSSWMSVSICSLKVQFVIFEDSILYKLVGKFSFVSFKIRPWCQILSKVCATSKKAVVAYSLFSNPFNIISGIRWSWWYVKCLGLKPNWWSGIIFKYGFILWSRSRFRS